MFKHIILGLVIAGLLSAFLGWFTFLRGNGGLTKMVSVTGIYAVCKPKDYDVVCFNQAGSDYAPFCMKLSDATSDGKCK